MRRKEYDLLVVAMDQRRPVESAENRRTHPSAIQSWTIAGALLCVFLEFAANLSAQTSGDVWSDVLGHPGWNYGGQISGGCTLVQISSPQFLTANRNISNFALSFHVGRVLSHEHGSGWARGTFEWGFSVIPLELFWVLGTHYAGGFEAFGPRWNFTQGRRRVVPFAGLAGGMLFSPHNFPPGDTYQANFTIGVDAGAHLFVRRKQSLDLSGRVYHLSNGFLGPLNPGIPVALQVTFGYSWF